MGIVYVALDVCGGDSESLTVTTTEYVPAVVGRPVMRAGRRNPHSPKLALARANPGGNDEPAGAQLHE